MRPSLSTFSNRDAHADQYADFNIYIDQHTHLDAHSDRHTDRNAHADAHTHADTHADQDANQHPHTDHYPHHDAHEYEGAGHGSARTDEHTGYAGCHADIGRQLYS